VLTDSACHLVCRCAVGISVAGKVPALRDVGMLRAGEDEECRDEDRICDAARLVRRDLERFSGRIGEAVEVEAVVPVSLADGKQLPSGQITIPPPVWAAALRVPRRLLMKMEAQLRGAETRHPFRQCREHPSWCDLLAFTSFPKELSGGVKSAFAARAGNADP